MSWIKTAYLYFISIILIVSLSIILAVLIFEAYCRFNPDKFHSYGWQTDNVAIDIINECGRIYGGDKVSVVLGDSFVEFYGDKEPNLVKQLALIDGQHNYCNLGVSGTGPKVYERRLEMVFESKRIAVDRVIVFLYEGNDYSDYLLKEQLDASENDRRQSFAMNIIKGSYAINFIYREIFKKYLIQSKIDPVSLARSVDMRDTDENVAKNIFEKTPRETVKRFQSDLLNVSWYSVALAMPSYFERVHSPKSDELKAQERITLRPLYNIIDLSKKNGANVFFCIIPHDYFLFNGAKQRWSETFRFENNNKINGPTMLSKYILKKQDNFFYPYGVFSEDDFIKDDGHLTYSGNKKLAQFCLDRISLATPNRGVGLP